MAGSVAEKAKRDVHLYRHQPLSCKAAAVKVNVPFLPLLDLGFLVDHVLAHDRVVLADLHLLGMQALVLGRGVEVTGAGARNELDLVAHGIDLRRVCRPRGVSRPPCRAPASRACAARASTGAASPSVPRPR